MASVTFRGFPPKNRQQKHFEVNIQGIHWQMTSNSIIINSK